MGIAQILGRSRVRARQFSALAKTKPAPAPAPDALNLLEAAAALVPQTLADNPAQLNLSNAILSNAIADIRGSHSRPARLVVCGTDTAGARDLVTALLQEPFSSDVQQAHTLRERWAAVPPEQTSLTIEYGDAAADGALHLPLAYLDQFPVPLQIIEASDPAVLQAADVPLLVSRLDQLHALNITRPDSLVVLNIDDAPESQPRASTSRHPATPTKYLFVNPSQALAALAALRDSPPGSPEAVERYQTAFLASRVPTLAQALHSILSSIDSPSKLRNRAALVQIRSALAASHVAIQDARAELDRIAAGVSDLDALLEEERVKVHREVFGLPDDHTVDRAVRAATDMLEYKLEHMKWRRMMFSIDEITTYLTTTLNRVWCIGLDKELTFHAGRLECIQRTLTDRAFALLAPANTRGLHSPVLHNTLRQLRATPAFPVVPTTLVGPLSARSAQILDAPTSRLHVAGQRALVGMGGATVAGAGLSWASWIGILMNADGITLLEPAAATATGVLVTLLGVRWAAWRWDTARKRWWEDVERVAGGLKQDLAEALDHAMENQVLVVARTGCAELSKNLGKRKRELDRLQDDVDRLSTAVEQLEGRK